MAFVLWRKQCDAHIRLVIKKSGTSEDTTAVGLMNFDQTCACVNEEESGTMIVFK